MRPTELYALQLELECKRILPSGRLGRTPCDNPDDLSLISLVRFLDGSGEFIRLREDATADVEAAVQRLSVDDLLIAHLAEGLAASAPAPVLQSAQRTRSPERMREWLRRTLRRRPD